MSRVRVPTPPPPGWETPRQVAARLGCHPATVHGWIYRELLEKRTDWCGNRVAVSTKAVNALVKRQAS